MYLGYRRREEAAQEKFTGDWFRAGALGYCDADRYPWYMGRKDDVVPSGGHRIGPSEIKDCLLKYPAGARSRQAGLLKPFAGNAARHSLRSRRDTPAQMRW